jgi:hypothetical protein
MNPDFTRLVKSSPVGEIFTTRPVPAFFQFRPELWAFLQQAAAPDALNEDILLIIPRQVGAARFGRACVGDTGAGGVKEKTTHDLLYLCARHCIACMHDNSNLAGAAFVQQRLDKPKFIPKSADDLRSTAAISHVAHAHLDALLRAHHPRRSRQQRTEVAHTPACTLALTGLCGLTTSTVWATRPCCTRSPCRACAGWPASTVWAPRPCCTHCLSRVDQHRQSVKCTCVAHALFARLPWVEQHRQSSFFDPRCLWRPAMGWSAWTFFAVLSTCAVGLRMLRATMRPCNYDALRCPTLTHCADKRWRHGWVKRNNK